MKKSRNGELEGAMEDTPINSILFNLILCYRYLDRNWASQCDRPSDGKFVVWEASLYAQIQPRLSRRMQAILWGSGFLQTLA